MIQKHILGQKALSSPYKIIAADIDNSESVSAVDLVHLRKLILGLIEEYPNGQESWRFVDKAYGFQNPADPFPYKEHVSFEGNNSNMFNQDFIGVKIGDVNNSAATSSLQATQVRNGDVLKLSVSEMEFVENDIVSLEFKASEFHDIIGYQFTLEFDRSSLDFVGMEPGVIANSESNFGFHRLEEGLVTTSWNEVALQNVSVKDVLFTLNFRAKRSENTVNTVKINSLATKAEAYTGNYNTMDVSLEFRTKDGIIEGNTFELYQNVPNPFSNITRINFSLPEETAVELSIFDVTGKLIHRQSGTFIKGFNTIVLDKFDLNSTGVMYYQIKTNSHNATMKMIGLE